MSNDFVWNNDEHQNVYLSISLSCPVLCAVCVSWSLVGEWNRERKSEMEWQSQVRNKSDRFMYKLSHWFCKCVFVRRYSNYLNVCKFWCWLRKHTLLFGTIGSLLLSLSLVHIRSFVEFDGTCAHHRMIHHWLSIYSKLKRNSHWTPLVRVVCTLFINMRMPNAILISNLD